MKKTYIIEDIDCPMCAKKVEAAIARVEGVSAASINFLAGKLTVELDEANEKEIMKNAARAAKKAVPDCRIKMIK